MDTYEKKYKEALEKARQLCAYPTTKPFISDLQDLFPELTESNDERIRKELIDAILGLWDNDALPMPLSVKRKDEWIAWLEKQGEPTDIPADAVLDSNKDGLIADTIRCKIEKQGEQKAIKVPKFKVGDFIQFNGVGHTRYTVKEVCGLSHYINTCNKRMDMSYTDANFELVEQNTAEWSEEDIKTIERIVCILDSIRYYNSVDNKQEKPYQSEIDWLKSIKDRAQPQPKQEWSEENDDDAWMNDIISKVENNLQLNKAEIDFLKSLKDRVKSQNTWKPSDKQMRAQVTLPTFTFEDVLALECSMKTAKITKGGDKLYEMLVRLYDKINNAYLIEKQGEEEEPQVYETEDGEIITYSESDGYKVVKPKFHKGDWITNGDYTWKIVDVKPLDYILQAQDGNIVDDTISYVDEQFHSFTIEDTKDGDVLVYNNEIVEIILLFKEWKNGNIGAADTYVHMFNNKINISNWCDCSYTAHPATKEQCDLLFQKMKEAGFEWDSEKKELKKISQRMISAKAKEAMYDKPTDNDMVEALRTEYEKGRADTIAEMYVPTQISPEESLGVSSEKYMDIVDTLTQGGQKPAKWSLEDERVIAIINNALTESNTPPDDYDKVYDWLESLKRRIGG